MPLESWNTSTSKMANVLEKGVRETVRSRCGRGSQLGITRCGSFAASSLAMSTEVAQGTQRRERAADDDVIQDLDVKQLACPHEIPGHLNIRLR